MNKQELFADLKVVELAGVLAGPAVGMFFAELGATVFKVENPSNNGDITRSWRLETESENGQSGYYSSVNYIKKIIWADLKKADDLEIIMGHIATADVVISNFKPSSARKMGLDSETLRNKFPKLIYAQISGYGIADDTPAFDVVLQAEAGFMYINGEADGIPLKMPIALIDILAAHQLKEAILVALLQRSKTGLGSIAHISLYNAALSSLANQATNYLMGNEIPQRMGSLHPNIAPYGETFYTNDGKAIVLAVGNDKQFVLLCKCLNIKNVADFDLYKSNSLRIQNRMELGKILAKAFLKFDSTTLLAALKNNNVPCGDIRSMDEVLDNETAQKLILSETLKDGQITKRMATAVFDIY
ncbi:CaiB/BaiF CoA transferase family protein [Flavobacterium restrictum]|uniref:CoA transferase n=1 Tax=Flavobacterium restrictum TaxID=2594428 RepID=A0A553E8G4_9FLAO|nr:CaiB/BaiF CoA-transferase family protein [Flavobacterium restrictum]TRX41316.1 CoA transferase [Flavobacterium restrictum]